MALRAITTGALDPASGLFLSRTSQTGQGRLLCWQGISGKALASPVVGSALLAGAKPVSRRPAEWREPWRRCGVGGVGVDGGGEVLQFGLPHHPNTGVGITANTRFP